MRRRAMPLRYTTVGWRSVWKSDLRKDLKICLFVAVVKSVLLYESESWTLIKKLTLMVNGYYTRMLRLALRFNQYRLRIKNESLPIVCSKIT